MQKALLSWNRGLISPLALARLDFNRAEFSAEQMNNWIPRKLGSMMLRPGWEYTGATKSNLISVSIPFVAATDDTARIELTDSLMRVWVDDALVTRAAVTAAFTNGGFDSDVTGWSDEDGASATSAWLTGGYLSLTGSGTSAAKRRQEVTVNEASTRHAINIEIERGPVTLRVGSSAGAEDYISEVELKTGSHSLAFTPTGNFFVDLFSYAKRSVLVDSIAVASSGTMELTAPWAEADLRSVRWEQSADVEFLACYGYPQRRIERRATDSWSLVLYEPEDGPFRVMNVGPITLTPTAIEADTTLTASAAFFKSSHVGALFRLTQAGQTQTADVTGADQFTSEIRIIGSDEGRAFAVSVAGTWAGTVTLQYSVGAPGDWIDAPSGNYTANAALSYDDTLDDQIIYYRIGIKAGDYTSGTAEVTISWSGGSQTGICRINSITSDTAAKVGVISDFGTVDATTDWEEGTWSGYRGYPSGVSLYEGRLWWGGKSRIIGSISDAYEGFDSETIGDAGPIQRSIGRGPVDRINWLVPAERMVLATNGAVWTARSSSLDEPLTAINFNLKARSQQGASDVAPVLLDTDIVYIQYTGSRIYLMSFDGAAFDYAVKEITPHYPEAGSPGVVKMAVQLQPEVRLHCVRSDGTVAILTVDRTEEVLCWSTADTDGTVEDVCILPGTEEDQVYYQVNRTVNGGTVRYHEKWALESECVGGTTNKQLDSFLTGSSASATLSGLSHLEGETVKVWAAGEYNGSYTVASGAITLTGVTGTFSYVVGLSYEARYKTAKLAYVSKGGVVSLTSRKRVIKLGVVAQNMHPLSLQFGPDFTTMDTMPLSEKYDAVDTDAIWAHYDEDKIEFPGDWDTDSRLCLKATAPLPVTLLAAIMEMDD